MQGELGWFVKEENGNEFICWTRHSDPFEGLSQDKDSKVREQSHPRL